MRLFEVCLLTLVSFGVMACSDEPRAGLSDVEKSSIADAVENRVQGYIDAARDGDVEWFMDFWADVDGFVVAGDGDIVDRTAWRQQVPGRKFPKHRH